MSIIPNWENPLNANISPIFADIANALRYKKNTTVNFTPKQMAPMINSLVMPSVNLAPIYTIEIDDAEYPGLQGVFEINLESNLVEKTAENKDIIYNNYLLPPYVWPNENCYQLFNTLDLESLPLLNCLYLGGNTYNYYELFTPAYNLPNYILYRGNDCSGMFQNYNFFSDRYYEVNLLFNTSSINLANLFKNSKIYNNSNISIKFETPKSLTALFCDFTFSDIIGINNINEPLYTNLYCNFNYENSITTLSLYHTFAHTLENISPVINDNFITNFFTTFSNAKITNGVYSFYNLKTLQFLDTRLNVVANSSYGPWNMEYMFANCTNLQNVNLIANSRNAVGVFYNCYNLINADISIYTYELNSCFENCYQLQTINFLSAKNYDNAFKNCYNLKNISYLNTTGNFINAFNNCISFNQSITLTGFAGYYSFNNMLYNCINFDSQIAFSTNWYNVANRLISSLPCFDGMLRNCHNFNKPIILMNIPNTTPSISNNSNMGTYNFYGNYQNFLRDCWNFNSFIHLASNRAPINSRNYANFFENCYLFNQPLNQYPYESLGVGQIMGMFINCSNFNQPLNLQISSYSYVDPNNWNNHIYYNRNAAYAFYNCTNFNASINYTNTSIFNMHRMYGNCTNFNQSIVIRIMNEMARNQHPLDISYMLENCINFETSIKLYDYNDLGEVNYCGLFSNCNNSKHKTLYAKSFDLYMEQTSIDPINSIVGAPITWTQSIEDLNTYTNTEYNISLIKLP